MSLLPRRVTSMGTLSLGPVLRRLRRYLARQRRAVMLQAAAAGAKLPSVAPTKHRQQAVEVGGGVLRGARAATRAANALVAGF